MAARHLSKLRNGRGPPTGGGGGASGFPLGAARLAWETGPRGVVLKALLWLLNRQTGEGIQRDPVRDLARESREAPWV